MAKRFSEVETAFLMNRPSLEERLQAYPELRAKIEAMIALRVVRANRGWEDYWSQVRQEAA